MNGVKANPDAQDGNEERGIWHKRLRLRKTSFSFPAEQNTVKEESNVTAHEQTGAEKSKECSVQSVNTFTCSECRESIAYRPAELMMHFKIVHGGKGSPPMFPCSMCDFSTPVFTTLQQHRMKHKDSVFTCDICEDNVQQTLPQLTQHCQTHHSLNGQYYCPKCKLSAQEIEQFVCHSCSASLESITNRKLEAAQNDDLLKHMAAECRKRWSRRNWWRKRPPVCKKDNDLSQECKILLPKPEDQWTSTLLPFSTPSLLDGRGVLLDPEQTLEKTKQFLQRAVSSGNKWPVSLKNERALPVAPTTQANTKPHPGPRPAGKDKLTGLMEKNNISVPPDCTTKVVGFKMVDGKKHLVLKVIPSSKRDVSKDGESGVQTVNSSNQTLVKRSESNDISTSGNCLSQRKEQGRCAAQQRYLSSVVERIKSQQKDGCDNQERSDLNASINLSHNSPRSTKTKPNDIHTCTEEHMLAKDCQDKALSESEENFTACQGDSGCHSDLTSDAGSLEERCSSRPSDKAHNLMLESDLHEKVADSSSISGFECISLSSRTPLKDLPESLCHFPSEDGELLFHSSVNESTNNTDPREAVLPVGQSDCVREHSAPDLFQTVDELPLTTVSHLLDEVRVDQRFSSPCGSDAPPKDPTFTGGAQRSERADSGVFSQREDSSSSPSVPAATGPITSLSRKRMGDSSSADSHHVSTPQKRWASEDLTASVLYWEPAPRDAPTTLRLIPFSSSQSVQIPFHNQPIIVLNHPDAEIPELTNIMKVVRKHKGAVQRVMLSRKTLSALSEFHCDTFRNDLVAKCHASRCRREWPNGTVKERFSLKLRLKRVCGRKYTVIPTVSERIVLQPTFRCWFCGRLFTNQEAWVGHGQRHLMEATRGWNQLFNRQDNPNVH